MKSHYHITYNNQHEKTKSQLTIFSQKPNAAESLHMTMNLYLMDGSSISSNKQLMGFTVTNSEYSVEIFYMKSQPISF